MDKELLLNIFKIPSQTTEEEQMAFFIKEYLKEKNIDFIQDGAGNIYNISYPGKPLLSAHMDTVQDSIDAKLTGFIKIKQGIIGGYGVIGGDDKCGIYIILELLKYEKFNFLFTVEEESGGLGSSYFVKQEELIDIPYGLVLDRKGNSDIICARNNYGVSELEEALLELGKTFSYSSASGTFSDADNLNSLLSCANLSVGYYNAHTKNEYVNIYDLEDATEFVSHIVKNLKQNFAIPIKRKYNMFDSRLIYSKDKFDDDITSYEDLFCCDLCGAQGGQMVYLNFLKAFSCEDCLTIIKEEVDEKFFKINKIDADYYNLEEEIRNAW